jgi:hypothetical protein
MDESLVLPWTVDAAQPYPRWLPEAPKARLVGWKHDNAEPSPEPPGMASGHR